DFSFADSLLDPPEAIEIPPPREVPRLGDEDGHGALRLDHPSESLLGQRDVMTFRMEPKRCDLWPRRFAFPRFRLELFRASPLGRELSAHFRQQTPARFDVEPPVLSAFERVLGDAQLCSRLKRLELHPCSLSAQSVRSPVGLRHLDLLDER